MKKKIAKKVDIVIMIQPTSPLRKAYHIHKAIKKLHQMNLDSVWSVSEIDLKYNPLKQLKINDDGIDFEVMNILIDVTSKLGAEWRDGIIMHNVFDEISKKWGILSYLQSISKKC